MWARVLLLVRQLELGLQVLHVLVKLLQELVPPVATHPCVHQVVAVGHQDLALGLRLVEAAGDAEQDRTVVARFGAAKGLQHLYGMPEAGHPLDKGLGGLGGDDVVNEGGADGAEEGGPTGNQELAIIISCSSQMRRRRRPA